MNRIPLLAAGALLLAALALPAPAEPTFRPDWHTGDYPNRDAMMWQVIAQDLKTSFPRGGAPVKAKPFRQDEREIFKLEDLGLKNPRSLRAASEQGVAVEANAAFYQVTGGKAREIELPAPSAPLAVAGKTYRVFKGKLERGDGQTFEPVLEFGRDGLPDDEVRDAVIGPEGDLYVATASGIGVMNPEGKWRHVTGKQGGLPVNDATALSFAKDGTLWVGTKHGAARRNPDGTWNYRAGPRWMIGEEVVDIAATDNGGAWILTAKSLTRLYTRTITLREKAKLLDEMTQLRHVRHGAVTDCSFRDVNDPNSWYMTDSDNDGLWTSIYLGAKCFEYAATKDPEAKRIAQKHFAFMERLTTINGSTGFVARSLRPSKFEPNSREQYNYGGEGEWHESTVEPGWQWKADTSSDELSGHYFVYGTYYDYVAKGDPAEEKRVQDIVRRVTNFIIDNDFCFVDLDGHPTRWAIYTPRLLHGDLMWSDQVHFNALGILAHLKVAIHVCGDQKFKDAYKMLMDKWGYHVKAMHAKEMLPNTPGAGINHSDDEMAWLEYYHLLLYPDEDKHLRHLYRYSAARSMRPEVPERSPFFTAVFGVEFPEWAHMGDALDALQRWPVDQRNWRVKNSVRDDVIIDPRSSRHGRPLLLEPVPIDERVPHKWNHDPYVSDEGGDGRNEEDGGPWLLPYWMSVYHKLIVEEP